MNGGDESDPVTVPVNSYSQAAEQQAAAAERDEGRARTKENNGQAAPPYLDALAENEPEIGKS